MQLTIDSTVVHAYFKSREAGHENALRLVSMAEAGELRLVIAAQGSALDMPDGPLAERLAHLIQEGTVKVAHPVSRFGPATAFGPGLVFGRVVPEFWEAWDYEVATWPTHERASPGDKDRWQVESHLLSGSDVFVTDDKSLRKMCKQMTGRGHAITARSLAGCVADLDAK